MAVSRRCSREREGPLPLLWLRSAAFNLTFYAASVVIVIAATPCFVLPRRCTVRAMAGWSHMTLWLLRVLAGTRYEVRGTLPEGGVLLASKHQSMWDTIVMTAILNNPAMVLKRELLWIPFYGWYAQKSRMIAIDRGAGSNAIRRLVAQGKAAIAEGRPIVIFPEGTRTALREKKEFQPGVAALYSQLKCAVVPVALNSGIYWPKKVWVKKAGEIKVQFLNPIGPGLKKKEFCKSP